MNPFKEALNFFRRVFSGQNFQDADEEERPSPLSTVPPSETREHVAALFGTRLDGHFVITSVLSSSEFLSNEEREALGSEYERLREAEGSILISNVGLVYVRGSPKIFVQMTMSETLTEAEAQDLGEKCFELMRGKRGDLFLAAVADRNLDPTRCYMLSRPKDGGRWESVRVKESLLTCFQIDSPGVFANSAEDPVWDDEDLQMKIITGKERLYAGYVTPRELLSRIATRKAFSADEIRTRFPIEVSKKCRLTRIYNALYQKQRRLMLAVYDLDTGMLRTYNDRFERKANKHYPRFILNEIDENGVPYISDMVTISQHMGFPIVQRRQSIQIVMDDTPAPARARPTPRPRTTGVPDDRDEDT